MPKIFISYRREDSELSVGRLHDWLARHFDRDNVFLDVDNIPFGVDFRRHLVEVVGRCDVLLAVIGESWLEVPHPDGPGAGRRRLDDPADFVRVEIESALAGGIPVIPVLVGSARMPSEPELPAGIRGLAYRNAAEVRHGRDYHDHVMRLIQGIESLIRAEEQNRARRRQDGEAELARMIREGLDRTQGQLTEEVLAAVKEMCREYRVGDDRSQAIIDQQVEQWRQERPMELQPGDAVPVSLCNGVAMTFAWIPPGEFLMGSPQAEVGRWDDEGPQRRVTIAGGFYLGVSPVTQAQWKAVRGANPSHFRGDDLPVDSVSWAECQGFLEKLSQYKGRAFRLPTEAEWEYACRAGTTTRYHGGDGEDALGNAGWYERNSGGQTQPVGRLVANAWGLVDMHGNVAEWCEDVYGPYGAEAGGATGGDARVLRGGSYCQDARRCRSAFRSRADASSSNGSCGFRVCFHLE